MDLLERPTRRMVALPGRGDGALAVLEFGPAERPVDLAFLHANGFNALTYRHILAPLAERFRIIAVDQRGHGATTLPARAEGRLDWSDFRDDFLALMAALDLKGVVVAGHSMGGATALAAAASAPERVSRLALFEPVIPAVRTAAPPERSEAHSSLINGARRRRAEFPSRQAAFAAYKGRGAFATWPDDMLADYIEAGFRDLPEGGVRLSCEPEWEASTFLAQANDPWSDFARAACPIDILKAEQASTCRTDGAEADLTADGRVSIEMVPGTSHFLPMERPALVRDVLTRALEAR